MPPARGAWGPANVFEHVLRYACERDDTDLFLRTLARTPLYLPGFADRGTARPLLTWAYGGRTYLLAFTSPEALRQRLGGAVGGWRPTSLAELRDGLPRLAAHPVPGAARTDPQWGVAIDPDLPIRAYLDQDDLAAMSGMLAAEPVFHPADTAEAVMFAAQRTGDPAAYLDAFAAASVHLAVSTLDGTAEVGAPGFPWLVRAIDGEQTVTVYTSEQRLAEAGAPAPLTVRLPVLVVMRAWPDRSWRLAVNPGSAIAATFTGDQVADLIRWAHRLAPPRGVRSGSGYG